MLWGTLRVIVGAIVTLASSFLLAALLPILVLLAAPIVGDSLPTWLFALPLLACPFVGGASTGFPRATDWTVDTFLGGLAAALGATVIGGLFGLVLTVLIMKAMPAHGATTADFSDIATIFGSGDRVRPRRGPGRAGRGRWLRAGSGTATLTALPGDAAAVPMFATPPGLLTPGSVPRRGPSP